MATTEQVMSFFGHMEELRRRLFWIVASLLVSTAICFNFSLDVIDFLKSPLDPDVKLYYMNVMEPFMAKIKVAFFSAFFLSLPITMYHALAFVAPALEKDEKKFFYGMVAFFVFLFFLGASVSYTVIMPFGVQWLVGQAELDLNPVLSVSQYISFAMLFLLAVGVVFETPVVILLLVKIGVTSPEALRRNWRTAYIVLMLVSAIATPDWNVIPMILLSVIMVMLYEMSVFLSKYMVKKDKIEEHEEGVIA